MTRGALLALASVVIIICLLASAGCASIPGPDVRFTPTPTKTTVTATPQVKATTLNIGRTPTVTMTPGTITVMPTTKTTTVPASATSPVYETRSCAVQGGTVAVAGEQCPGTWLNAQDTFNCCSVAPARETTRNTSIVVEPYDLVIVMDDDPGSVLP